MSSIGYPQSGISAHQFFARALNEADANKRRRLFADARQSNLCTYQIYVLAAEAEESWGANAVRLQSTLMKGIIVFRNPAGQGAQCPKVTKTMWLQEADAADARNHTATATELRKLVNEPGLL
ncbi:hypothetical protein EDD11_000352 [Mortierella claussenii]|nr:hypothetical protein EDD11_000352 [Mortierella claussenii]